MRVSSYCVEERMGQDATKLVLKRAIQSRCFLLVLIIVWRVAFAPYDSSSSLNPQCITSQGLGPHSSSNLESSRIGSALRNSIVWDSVYFVRIAECQYEYEQSYAFLPLLPLFIHFFSRIVLFPLIPLIGYRAVLSLAGYIICNTAFVVSAVYFYRLSEAILRDREMALRASILFCFNPASIFYSSIYSESLYSVFSLGGLYHLFSGHNNFATLWFVLSGCTRSNGFLNAGYLCYITMHKFHDALIQRKICLAVKVLVVGALRCALIFAPFIAFQLYGYCNLCFGHLPGERSPWCERKVPLLYNYIQSHYWGVGFLKYYELKQIPNMLLATPTLALAICSIIYFVRLQPETFCSLGFQPLKSRKKIMTPFSSLNVADQNHSIKTTDSKLRHKKHTIKDSAQTGLLTEQYQSEKPRYLSSIIVPCTLHLGFLVATAILVMHVQVATRFLSASPPIYWFAAYMMGTSSLARWSYLIWAYCAAYIFLGSLLFSNFYPFT